MKAKINEVNQIQENNEVTVKVNEKNVSDIKKEYSQWEKEQEEEKASFKEIMEQQKETTEENLTKEVIK